MADERIAVVLMAWLVTAVVPAELVELPLLLTSSPIATTAAGAEESALAARLRPAKSSLAMARIDFKRSCTGNVKSIGTGESLNF